MISRAICFQGAQNERKLMVILQFLHDQAINSFMFERQFGMRHSHLVERLSHAIAEELEHVSSLELIQKLDNFLNFPQTDPHGDPIPDINGKLPVIKQVSLVEAALNKNMTVSSVANQSPEMLELLNHYHIGIGTVLRIIGRFSFDGSVEIKVSRQAPCIISEQVAKNIFVYHD